MLNEPLILTLPHPAVEPLLLVNATQLVAVSVEPAVNLFEVTLKLLGVPREVKLAPTVERLKIACERLSYVVPSALVPLEDPPIPEM
ncbi:hypothetical protein [Deinococcus arenae]|uniref:hypothetical protein n=1 Tax=Deinococcus arenae TaxID=1452751 RepID=UPI0013A62188|nr:hypothetical protein [Deinococcus arenae]